MKKFAKEKDTKITSYYSYFEDILRKKYEVLVTIGIKRIK